MKSNLKWKSNGLWFFIAAMAGVLALSGCGGGDDSKSHQAAKKQIEDDADNAKKQLSQLKGVTMKGGELSGGDAAGHPLWRIAAKNIRVFDAEPAASTSTPASTPTPTPNDEQGNNGDDDKKSRKRKRDDKLQALSNQPRRAVLTSARAWLYKDGKVDSTFLSPMVVVHYTPDGVRFQMTGGMRAQSAGGWTGKRGPVSLVAPRADVDVKTRRIWAHDGVHMVQGAPNDRIYVSADQMKGDASFKTARLLGNIKASAQQGKFTARQADYNWQTNRASAQGGVSATHDKTTLTGDHLEADTAANRGVLIGNVHASGEQGKATASRVSYDWNHRGIVASGGVLLTKDEVSVQAAQIATDDKFDSAVATGDVTLKKADATLRAGRVETKGKGETATASGGVTLVKGDATISASHATAYNLGKKDASVVANGDVHLKRGDLTITAGAATATGLQNKNALRVVATSGVHASSKDGDVRASSATWGGGQIVASGNVTIVRDGNRLNGSHLVCDDKFTQAVLTGDISGRMVKGETMTAGKLTYRKNAGIVADGGVTARKGDLRLKADHLTSSPDGNHILLTGNVVVTNAEGARVLAHEARYERLEQKIYAAGDVYLQDPKRGLRQRGKKLVADLKLNKATLEGVTGSGKMNVFSDKKLF